MPALRAGCSWYVPSADRPGHPRVFAVRADHQAGADGAGRRVACARTAAYAADPTVLGQDLVDVEALEDLRAGGPGGVNHDRVEDRAAGTVDGVDVLEARVRPGQNDVAVVEPDVRGGGAAARGDLVQQPPTPKAGDARQLNLVGGERVAGEARPVDREHP
jgi:hypothetical protein